MQKKKQHYIPVTYLKSWCSPDIPIGHEPSVWYISKDGQDKQKKSPSNMSYKNNFYTSYSEDGERNIDTEEKLSAIESNFSKIRDNRINKEELLTKDEYGQLCDFIMTMSVRTPKFGNHFKHPIQQMIDHAKFHYDWLKQASPLERDNARKQHTNSSNYPPSTTRTTILELETLLAQPYPSGIDYALKVRSPAIQRLPMVIFKANSANGFITSDHPVVIFPYLNPPESKNFDILTPEIIYMPLNPRKAIFITDKNTNLHNSYIEVSAECEDELNTCIRKNADQFFVSLTGLSKPCWFN